jgi:hypothetical protein
MDVGELIFSGQTVEMTVYVNSQLIPLATLDMKV